MEMYLLDSLLRRIDVVDKFESLIWTERYSDIGDFELLIHSNRHTRSQFLEDSMVAINKSYRVMRIKTVEDTTDEEGKAALKVTGRSLEDILEDRVAKYTMSNLEVEPNWVLTGLPADIARQMFDRICRDGALSASDIIPFLMPGHILPTGNIPEPGTSITWTQEPDSLFAAIQSLCITYDLGFRLIRNFDTSQLYFAIYSGDDRTTRQTVLAPVVFAPNYDNLKNTTELKTIQDSKNVAYVFSEFGWKIVYPDNVDPADATGFHRHVIKVDASDITEDTINVDGALEQAGKEALLQARTMSAFDGELNQTSQYLYGRDYNLGDLVELRNEDGVITYRRVSEQIFVDDGEGERSYPTLTANDFLVAGTWLTAGDIVWEDFDLEEWANM